MRFADKETKTTLTINEHICLSGIPEEAHRYVVNGRTPLEWFIDRYKIKERPKQRHPQTTPTAGSRTPATSSQR